MCLITAGSWMELAVMVVDLITAGSCYQPVVMMDITAGSFRTVGDSPFAMTSSIVVSALLL